MSYLKMMLDDTHPPIQLTDWELLTETSQATLLRVLVIYTIHIVLTTCGNQSVLVNLNRKNGFLIFLRIVELVIHVEWWSKNCPSDRCAMEPLVKDSTIFLTLLSDMVSTASWIQGAEYLHGQLDGGIVVPSPFHLNQFIDTLDAVWMRFAHVYFLHKLLSAEQLSGILTILAVSNRRYS
jgi:hypothetical protein